LGAAKEVKSLLPAAGDPGSCGGVFFFLFHLIFSSIYFPSGFFPLFP